MTPSFAEQMASAIETQLTNLAPTLVTVITAVIGIAAGLVLLRAGWKYVRSFVSGK